MCDRAPFRGYRGVVSTMMRARSDLSARAPGVVSGMLAPLLGALLSALGVLGTWWVFVTTGPGQLMDDAAWQGSQFGRRTLSSVTMPVLEVVSAPFIVGAVVASALIAIAQRRWSIAGGAVVLLAGANLTTQLLKKLLLERPDLHLTELHLNSLPSGHTTVAASVAATALLISPGRWRGTVAIVGTAYAAATGLATMVGGWHRPSDVVAAYAVAAFWYFVVEAARTIPARHPLPRGYRGAPGRNALTILALVAGVCGAVGLAVLGITAVRAPVVSSTGEVVAYVGSCFGVVAVAALAGLAMLAMRPRHAASSYSAGS